MFYTIAAVTAGRAVRRRRKEKESGISARLERLSRVTQALPVIRCADQPQVLCQGIDRDPLYQDRDEHHPEGERQD